MRTSTIGVVAHCATINQKHHQSGCSNIAVSTLNCSSSCGSTVFFLCRHECNLALQWPLPWLCRGSAVALGAVKRWQASRKSSCAHVIAIPITSIVDEIYWCFAATLQFPDAIVLMRTIRLNFVSDPQPVSAARTAVSTRLIFFEPFHCFSQFLCRGHLESDFLVVCLQVESKPQPLLLSNCLWCWLGSWLGGWLGGWLSSSLRQSFGHLRASSFSGNDQLLSEPLDHRMSFSPFQSPRVPSRTDPGTSQQWRQRVLAEGSPRGLLP